MKRLRFYSCVLMFVVVFFGLLGTQSSLALQAPDAEIDGFAAQGNSVAAGELHDGASAVSATPIAATKPKIGGDEIKPGECKLMTSSFSMGACITEFVTWLIKVTFLEIAGFLAWLSANMLNLSIQIGILNFSQWAPESLYPIWMIIRQIVSLAVVFAGLFLGFMYIIGREDTFGRYIGWIVIFALFVNFSYPVTRTLIDISNVISLNIYSSTVGGDVISGNSKSSAGAEMINRLGLSGLASSATAVKDSGDMLGKINSVPGALMAVAFVLYAAFIFFKATWIITSRTAILVFLTVASPILLIDSVVPKLGEKAAELRKLFFEQLFVAPVFMIMLALTLKFLDVFNASGALSQSGGNTAVAFASADSIQTFFNILMMLIMLHITLKVTESLAGNMGNYLGGVMGKVGGFGLGVATGGAGLLARGSVGMAAARLRDSKVMDSWQGSRTGRGLYSLTNSLARSSYDLKNVGMVNKGMAKAGMGMGEGQKGGYDTDFKNKEANIKGKYSSIKNLEARQKYLNQKTNSAGSYVQKGINHFNPLLSKEEKVSDAELIAKNIGKDKEKLDAKYLAMRPDKQKEYYAEQTKERQEELDKLTNKSAETTKAENSSSKPVQNIDWDKVTYEGQKPESTPVVGDGLNIHTDDFTTQLAQRRASKLEAAAKNAEKEMAIPKTSRGPDNGPVGATVAPSPNNKPSSPGSAATFAENVDVTSKNPTQSAEKIAHDAIAKAQASSRNGEKPDGGVDSMATPAPRNNNPSPTSAAEVV